MTKIDLNSAPYFDDYNEKKQFYRILFRPGRAVQARELTQLQTILQNQISRLGKHVLDKNALVYPRQALGCKFAADTFFLKVDVSVASGTSTASQIENYWLNKRIVGAVSGVEGVVIGYHILKSTSFDSSAPSAVRLFVALQKASQTHIKFQRGENIRKIESNNDSDALSSALTAKISDEPNCIGRIASVEIPESIYYYNGHFVVVDAQYFFITPDDPQKPENWNATPTCDVGIEMTESIVTFEDDTSLLENANNTSNFSAPGADRLKISATLVAKKVNSDDQNLIKLLTLVNGIITVAHQLEYDPFSNPLKAELATRTKEESGDYVVSPFLAETKELIGENNTGVFTEETLSYGYEVDDDSSRLDAIRKAGLLSKNLFRVPLNADGTPKVALYNQRAYPGSSYDDKTASNEYKDDSFKGLVRDHIGIRLEAGTAYVKGYRVNRIGQTNIAVKRARTSDLVPNALVLTPLSSFLYVTDVYGPPPIEDFDISNTGSKNSYGEVNLYSILNSADGTAPNSQYKIGSARVFGIDYYTGGLGNKSSVFKLGVFDLNLNDGKTMADVRSLYGSGFSTGTFSANLSLVDVSVRPTLEFQGLIQYSAPIDTSTISNVSYTYSVGATSTTLKLEKQAAAVEKILDTANSGLNSGTAIQVSYSIQNASGTVTKTEIKTIVKNTITPASGVNIQTIELLLDSSLSPKDASGNTINGVITVTSIKTVYKVRGVGTAWRSKPGEALKKGDQVSIGSGENAKIYTVFSNPASDNELNLVPDPSLPENSPWRTESGSIMQYLVSEPLQEATVGNAGLVFKLQDTSIRTIRGGVKNAPEISDYSITYQARRVHKTNPQNSGSTATISVNQQFERVVSGSDGYIIVDNDGRYYSVSIDEGTPQQNNYHVNILPTSSTTIKLQFPEFKDATSSKTFTVFYPVEKSGAAAREATKTSIKGSFDLNGDYVGGGSVVVSPGSSVSVSLGKADVFKITRVIESANQDSNPSSKSTLNPGDKIITGAYMLDDGQTDYYYGISKAVLRSGGNKPKGKVRIEFDYFRHNADGDFFTVDSYVDVAYDDIPSYTSKKEGMIDLKSCIDFRPIVDRETSTLKFANYKEFPHSRASLSATYHVWEGRKDKLYIDSAGNVLIKYGVPSINPIQPSEPEDGITLYDISHVPYTATHKQCSIVMRDNRRFTMRDIAKLEGRIKNLEYYTSLSMLESDTKDLVVLDALGQNKFKHGFMTDNFENLSKSDIDYLEAAIDSAAGELKPKIFNNHVDLEEYIPNTGRNHYQVTSNLFTLPYTNTSFLEQPLCSRVINVNPYNTQSWIGNVQIDPWTDTWRETRAGSPLVVQDDSAYNTARRNFNKDGESILWLGERQSWQGLDIYEGPIKVDKVNYAGHAWPTRDEYYKDKQGRRVHYSTLKDGDEVQVPFGMGFKNEGEYVKYKGAGEGAKHKKITIIQKGEKWNEGIKSTIKDLGYSNPVSMGTRIVESSAATYMRSRAIKYVGKGFLPNSKIYAFFDNINVTKYCVPESGSGQRAEDPANIHRGPYVNSGAAGDLKVTFSNNSIILKGSRIGGTGTLFKVVNNKKLDALYGDFLTPPNDNSILTGGVKIEKGADNIWRLKGIPSGANATRFLSEIEAGSVINISDVAEVVVTEVEDNYSAKISTSTNPSDTNSTSSIFASFPGYLYAFDKTEYLQRQYVGKYVDVTNCSVSSRNFLDKRIQSISYTPTRINIITGQAIDAELKFTFTEGNFQAGDESGSGLTLMVKHATSHDAPADPDPEKTFLQCDSTGSVKGTFTIPNPTAASNPKFNTGEKYFRLTNSITNADTNDVSRAQAKYTATGWIDVTQETLYSTKQFNIEQSVVLSDKEPIRLKDSFDSFEGVCPMDPLAQSFTITQAEGIFITAVDIFFYSKSPDIPIRFQIRPMDDGGNPSVKLLYEKIIDATDVVVNKVDLKTQKIKIIGASNSSPNYKPGFNAPPWNTGTVTPGDLSKVYSKNFLDGQSQEWDATHPANNGIEFEYTRLSNGQANPAGDMIPTRIVFDYPIYLVGKNTGYCFVILTDAVAGEGADLSALESTYQVYMAQKGVALRSNESATPVHLVRPLEAGEDDLNLILGTSIPLGNIPTQPVGGVMFKSVDGRTWSVDQLASLKYNIHKAVFDTTKNGEAVLTNTTLEERQLSPDPFLTSDGKHVIRVYHRNHNIPENGHVVFTGGPEEADSVLNGIPYYKLFNRIHTISNPTLDTYVIDLGQGAEATSSGFVGGPNIRASNNIRFEEFLLMANPSMLPDTEITWRIDATTAKTPYDPSSEAYNKVPTTGFSPNSDVVMPLSSQIYSKLSEDKELAGDRSLKIYATLSSKSPNISPVLNSERMGIIAKGVRLNDPYGTGDVNNINNPDFDTYVCLPTSINPSVSIQDLQPVTSGPSLRPGKLFFTDTDNRLTGTSFKSIGTKVTCSSGNALFAMELSVGDTIKHPIENKTAKVTEVVNNNELITDTDIGLGELGEDYLLYNPPYLKIKTSDVNVAAHLSRLDVGKYLSVSGTHSYTYGTDIINRNFENAKILKVKYTPTASIVDLELGAPCLCELEIAHFLDSRISKGFESFDGADPKIVQLDNYIDEIAPYNGSVASKYVSGVMAITKPANCLKVMFDGCRPEFSNIDLYYRTGIESDVYPLETKNWKKLEYSIEQNGVLQYIQPGNNASMSSFNAYEANALQISNFTLAQVKLVLRGGKAHMYPKIRNLRILALEE